MLRAPVVSHKVHGRVGVAAELHRRRLFPIELEVLANGRPLGGVQQAQERQEGLVLGRIADEDDAEPKTFLELKDPDLDDQPEEPQEEGL